MLGQTFLNRNSLDKKPVGHNKNFLVKESEKIA